MSLQGRFEENEVLNCLKLCAADKAPGPDGYTMGFFIKCRDIPGLSRRNLDLNAKLLSGQREPHNYSESHCDAVVRILQYRKPAPGKGLLFEDQGNEHIIGYTDVDWAGSPSDRRSTSEYCVLVGGNLVSWKKYVHILTRLFTKRTPAHAAFPKKVPPKLKGKFYRVVVRLTLLYGAQCWALKNSHVQKMDVVKKRMLSWMCGHIKSNKIRNEDIQDIVGV
ncbi:hypothetical protein MTR67_023536 [Solanum verrucosum]|uniref:Reverse transcriptase domain-containing protein n=1 Tax=Solanum verrucosum TaxID=315347 RepID=A0AAF0QVD8_SOLVR|nr:hypothetical protein MTR67_023536 [Solanum verrucosum]